MFSKKFAAFGAFGLIFISGCGSQTASNQASALAASIVTTTFTMEEVAKHAGRESCYAAVRGSVYDLTSWIDRHPGGAERILSLCGKDGTAAFEGQHGGQARPEKELAGFKIGVVTQ